MPGTNDLDYGARLSCEEYEASIIQLHGQASPMPSKVEDTTIRKKELNLSIDHRLGVNFPDQKRKALWLIMQRVEKKRLWLAFKYGLKSLFFRKKISKRLNQNVDALAGYLVEAFSEVLSERELEVFFELKQEEIYSLSADSKNIKK